MVCNVDWLNLVYLEVEKSGVSSLICFFFTYFTKPFVVCILWKYSLFYYCLSSRIFLLDSILRMLSPTKGLVITRGGISICS